MTFGRKKTGKTELDAAHAFWDHQPMPRLCTPAPGRSHLASIASRGSAAEKNIKENTHIEAPKDPVKDIRQTPLDLLKEFEWSDTDIDDPAVAKVRRSRGEVWVSLTTVAGGVRPAEPELRGGRRQHVPLRLLGRVPPMVRRASRRGDGRLTNATSRALKPPGYRKNWRTGLSLP